MILCTKIIKNMFHGYRGIQKTKGAFFETHGRPISHGSVWVFHIGLGFSVYRSVFFTVGSVFVVGSSKYRDIGSVFSVFRFASKRHKWILKFRFRVSRPYADIDRGSVSA